MEYVFLHPRRASSKQIKAALRSDFSAEVMTGSRVYRLTNGTGKVVHNWRTENETESPGFLVGDGGRLAALADANQFAETLFGHPDANYVTKVLVNCTGQEPVVQLPKTVDSLSQVTGISLYLAPKELQIKTLVGDSSRRHAHTLERMPAPTGVHALTAGLGGSIEDVVGYFRAALGRTE
jgi:hypothetical protein